MIGTRNTFSHVVAINVTIIRVVYSSLELVKNGTVLDNYKSIQDNLYYKMKLRDDVYVASNDS